MNKKILFNLILIFTILIFTSCNNYLDNYFNGEKFQTVEFDMEDSTLYLSYIQTDNSNLVKKGIIYFKEKKLIKSIFFIDNYLIKDYKDNQISFPIATQEFYGWKIDLVQKTSLHFQIYTDNGTKTTDSINFNWNKENKTFEQFKINPTDL